MRRLTELVRQLEQVKREAKALGIFTNDRELLACSVCGLLEDVTVDGRLVTYPRSDRDAKDCGLRFIPVEDVRHATW